MWVPDFVIKIIGHKLADKLKLEDGPMDGTKKWWASKGVWTAVITVLIAAYGSAAVQFNLPHIPEWIFTLLGAASLYSRTTATDKIG